MSNTANNLNITPDKFEVVGKNLSVAQAIVRPSMTYWQDAWRRLKKNKVAMASLIFLIFLTIMATVGPFLVKFSYRDQDLTMLDKIPMTAGHIFGTDMLGRDMFARVWVGARISLFIGIAGAAVEFFIGIIYGGISGYFGGIVDDIMMRIVDILYSLPDMIVIILLMVIMGPGLGTIILALGITHWLIMARIVRGQILQIKEQEYVLAARTLGAGSTRLIAKHLIPNCIGPIIVRLTFAIPAAIFAEAFLSFIGLGVPMPLASWGTLAAEGQRVMAVYPHELFIPAFFISLAMLSFNLLGDGLRDALDPRMRK